jgi:hypothetical protein
MAYSDAGTELVVCDRSNSVRFDRRSPALQVRVRIIRQPLGAVDDIALSSYRVGRVYDLPVSLGHYLIAENLAICEMRRDDPPPFKRYPGDRRGKSID